MTVTLKLDSVGACPTPMRLMRLAAMKALPRAASRGTERDSLKLCSWFDCSAKPLRRQPIASLGGRAVGRKQRKGESTRRTGPEVGAVDERAQAALVRGARGVAKGHVDVDDGLQGVNALDDDVERVARANGMGDADAHDLGVREAAEEEGEKEEWERAGGNGGEHGGR